MTSALTSTININRLALNLLIGCLPEERKAPQRIEISLKLFLPAPPAACRTDKLEDTTCYHTVCTIIQKTTQGTNFNTLEKLAHHLLTALEPALPRNTKLWLKVSKMEPPIEDIQGETEFTLSTLPPEIAWSIA